MDAPPPENFDCPHCLKPAALCVCDLVTPFDNLVELLILQHPQEQDRLLGTARLAAMQLQNAVLKIGLSWPSLARHSDGPPSRGGGPSSISALPR